MLTEVVGAVHRFFLTIFYFIYFLFKGKPEWKCDREREKELERKQQKICCVDCSPLCEHQSQQAAQQGKGLAATAKDYLSWLWGGVCHVGATVWFYTKRVAQTIWHWICAFGRWVRDLFRKIGPTLRTVFLSSAPSQELPPPTYNSFGYRPVLFDDNEKSQSDEVSYTDDQFKDVIAPASRPPIPVAPRSPTPTSSSIPHVPVSPTAGLASSPPEVPPKPEMTIPLAPPPPPSLSHSNSARDNAEVAEFTKIQNGTANGTLYSDAYKSDTLEFNRDATKTPVQTSYIQEPNIDLSTYTKRVGGVGERQGSVTRQDEQSVVRRRREGSVGPPIEGQFYSQRTFVQSDSDGAASPPPPAPPPPPGARIRIPTSMDRETTPRIAADSRKDVRGAVPMLPVSVLEQMSASTDSFGDRTERGCSATVTERVREANSKTPVLGRKTPVREFERNGRTPERVFERPKTPSADYVRPKTPVADYVRPKTPVTYYDRPKTPVVAYDRAYDRDRPRTPVAPREQTTTPMQIRTKTPVPFGHRETSVSSGWRSVTPGPEIRYRAQSVGPATIRPHSVVSRIDDPSSDESRFIFRARNAPHEIPGAEAFLMGRSVYTPLPEAEGMRDSINRRCISVMSGRTDVASPFEPLSQTSSVGGVNHRDDAIRRRSRTVGPGARESLNRDVNNRIRPWLQNGATVNGWNQDFPQSISEYSDGSITTKIKRVSEKTIEDNWKWRDENGMVVDEKSERSWRGDLDQVINDGPNRGRQFSRTVEVLPTGNALFQDVNRQYNDNYVVESICRNY